MNHFNLTSTFLADLRIRVSKLRLLNNFKALSRASLDVKIGLK